MKYRRRIFVSLFWILLGITLNLCSLSGLIRDDFWSAMGVSFLLIGVLQVIREIRYRSNEEYREKFDTEAKDERNRFIANKAWAWAGYLFILIAAVASIVLRVLHQDLLSLAASYSVCLMLILYWISYLILRKKY